MTAETVRNPPMALLAVAAVSAAATVMGSHALAGEAQTVVLQPVKDNTLIESTTGPLSLGAAEFFYAGRTGFFAGGTLRRGVLAFDVAGKIPEGSTITGASLTLYMSQTVSGEQATTLQRLTSDWGEGTSDGFGGAGVPATPGDATWLHTFYPDQFWTSAGGDFTSAVSATTGVAGVGFYTWENAAMVVDVQSFLDEPQQNFGWIVRGNEADFHTAKQFASREHTEAAWRPQLTVHFTTPTEVPGDLNGDGVVDVSDLLILLAAWGPCPESTECPADLNGDGVVDVTDLLILLGNWG